MNYFYKSNICYKPFEFLTLQSLDIKYKYILYTLAVYVYIYVCVNLQNAFSALIFAIIIDIL